MPKNKEFEMEIKKRKEQNTLVMKTVTPVSKLSEVLGKAYSAAAGHLGMKGMQPAGAPFCAYFNMDMENLEVECGFPVSEKIDGDGNELLASTLPGGDHAFTVHKGSYEKIGDAYDALAAFVKEQGREPSGVSYEIYLNSPMDVKPEELLTEIYFILK